MAIIRASDAQLREFKGVTFELLAVGEQSMVTKMKYRLGNLVPTHRHPNEQSGYVVSGRYRLKIADAEHVLESGDSYAIPADVEHSIEVLDGGEVVDVFTPPRPDYL
jgi:quercetin dioxygenase-like cupin family protein